MTPFRALYLKEFREHRISLLIVFAILFLMNLLPYAHLGSVFFDWLVGSFWVFGFYITAMAATSYAKEDEAKTSQFLRRLPVRSSTIFRAKFSWLLTSMAVLSLPLLFWGRLYLKLRVSDGVSEFFFWGVPVFICLLIWAYFWTTRWPNKVYAVLMTFVSAYVFMLFAVLIALMIANAFYGGRIWDITISAFTFLLSPFPIAWFAFRKVLAYYDGFEREKKTPVLISMPGQAIEKPKRRFVTRLFPSKPWEPFQGLLWQSFCQTRDVLILCLVPGLLTFLWFYFFPGFWENDNMPVRIWAEKMPLAMQKFVEVFGILTTMAAILILFAVASTVFSQDRESDRLRFLGYRGISLWKFWCSRMAPYVFLVLLIFLCAIIIISREMTEPFPSKNICRGLGILLTLISAPLCMGAFFSLLFRSLLFSIVLTVACSGLFYTSLPVFWPQMYLPLYFLPPFVLLGFLAASYSLAGSRLYERPLSKSWQRPTVAVMFAAICGVIPPFFFFLTRY